MIATMKTMTNRHTPKGEELARCMVEKMRRDLIELLGRVKLTPAELSRLRWLRKAVQLAEKLNREK